jgi:hypothetical protein
MILTVQFDTPQAFPETELAVTMPVEASELKSAQATSVPAGV